MNWGKIMKIVLVDDDKAMLLILKMILGKIKGIEIIKIFNNSRYVLEFIKEYNIDIIFLDINMPEENGMELAKKILEVSPFTDVVFTTSYEEYAVEAFEIYALDYIYYLNLTVKLGRYLFNTGDINDTYYISKKVLRFDPFNEEANCFFMKIFAAQRNKKSLIKHYENYVKMIEKELGVCPETAIVDLYEKLVNSF